MDLAMDDSQKKELSALLSRVNKLDKDTANQFSSTRHDLKAVLPRSAPEEKRVCLWMRLLKFLRNLLR